MDVLTFVAELVKAAVWPVAAIAIALIFRRQLRDLLSRIRKGRLGPAEFEFENNVRELSKISVVPPLPRPEWVETLTLATTNPRSAILEAFLRVERAATELSYQSQSEDLAAIRTPVGIARGLAKSGMSADDLAVFSELRALRNRAAHDAEFSPSQDSVVKYVEIAQALKERLDRAIELVTHNRG